MPPTRRTFLRRSSQALAIATFPYPLLGRSLAPSDTLSVGLIGCGGIGSFDLRNCLSQDGVVCAGICDVDELRLTERAVEVADFTGQKPVLYRDFRRMLDQDDLDAVIIATPDHWHCLQTILACEAGKHVYVEKPLANSIGEAQAMRRAVKRYGTVVQVGQQQRSGPHWQEAVAFVQSGKLGKVRRVEAWANFHYGRAGERSSNSAPPPTLDYDLWLGPAPQHPYHENRVHGTWRFQWDYGGGLLTDWGVHLLDIVGWAMQLKEAPRAVSSAGGIFAYPDRQLETPDTQTVLYEFDDWLLQWQHLGGIQRGPYEREYGIAFIGENGTLLINRNGWEVQPESEADQPRMAPVPFQQGKQSHHLLHAANFIDTIRGSAELTCPLEAGYQAATLAHMGNIAQRSGLRLAWDADQGKFSGQAAANAFLKPRYRKPWKFPT